MRKIDAVVQIRVPADLLGRLDRRVAELQSERPGLTRSDLVRLGIVRVLSEKGVAKAEGR